MLSAEQLLRRGERACAVVDSGGSLLDATDQTSMSGSCEGDAFILVILASKTLWPEHADAPSGT
ncbi:hypothetical protein [Blastococcus sp. SYSU DS0828]